MCRQSEKNLLNSNISSTSPHNMANFGPLTAELGSGVWGTPANFNGFRVLPSLLQRRRPVEANQTLQDVSPSPRLVHHILYIFSGSCPLTGFCPVQNSLYVQLLHSPTLAALLHGTPPASVSQALRCGTGNGITELSQRAPPIFGWTAITLGIGPHSSSFFITLFCLVPCGRLSWLFVSFWARVNIYRIVSYIESVQEFVANVNHVRYVVARPSVVSLSVCNGGAPYSGG